MDVAGPPSLLNPFRPPGNLPVHVTIEEPKTEPTLCERTIKILQPIILAAIRPFPEAHRAMSLALMQFVVPKSVTWALPSCQRIAIKRKTKKNAKQIGTIANCGNQRAGQFLYPFATL